MNNTPRSTQRGCLGIRDLLSCAKIYTHAYLGSRIVDAQRIATFQRKRSFLEKRLIIFRTSIPSIRANKNMLIVLHQDTFGHHHGGKDALEGILGQVHPELSNKPSVCWILSSFINIVFVFWKTKPTSLGKKINS